MEKHQMLLKVPMRHYEYLVGRADREYRKPGNLAIHLLISKIEEEIEREADEQFDFDSRTGKLEKADEIYNGSN